MGDNKSSSMWRLHWGWFLKFFLWGSFVNVT